MPLALLAGLIGVATQWWRAESHLKDAIYQQSQAEESRRRQNEANHSLQLANNAERTARQRAQNRFDAAMKALGEFESITNDAAVLREPQFEALRGKLLRTALGFYRELQASLEEDASPEARFQLSDAYCASRFRFVGAWPAGRGPGIAPAGPRPGRADGRCGPG